MISVAITVTAKAVKPDLTVFCKENRASITIGDVYLNWWKIAPGFTRVGSIYTSCEHAE